MTRGYDAGKKINGRKRHIAVDTLGLLLVIMVSPASIQDRRGGKALLWLLGQRFPSVKRVWADGGYTGRLVTWLQSRFDVVLDIVKRNDDVHGFEVLPHRWIVERTFGWFMCHRRLCRDYERLPKHAEAMAKWAMVAVMNKRLTRAPGHAVGYRKKVA